jgi:hypothetical protein
MSNVTQAADGSFEIHTRAGLIQSPKAGIRVSTGHIRWPEGGRHTHLGLFDARRARDRPIDCFDFDFTASSAKRSRGAKVALPRTRARSRGRRDRPSARRTNRTRGPDDDGGGSSDGPPAAASHTEAAS